MILFVLGLHLLQSRGYLLVRGGLGLQHQKGLGDKMVGTTAPRRGCGPRRCSRRLFTDEGQRSGSTLSTEAGWKI